MVMTSWPRVNEDTTDTQYSEFFNSIIGTGLRDTNALTVTADSSGLNVKVSTGFAVVAGTAFLSTAVETLAISPNTGSIPRIDAVILRRDFAAAAGQTVRLMVKTGTATAPAMSQNVTGVFELLLATVTVAPSAATITSANVQVSRTYLAGPVGIWTTATRPTARVGVVGFNTSTGAFEGHNGTTWTGLVSWDTLPGRPAAIPVAQGGTGATDAAGARVNLGAAPTSHMHDIGDITHSAYNNERGSFWLRYLPDNYAAKAHVHDIGHVWQDGKPIMENYLPNTYAGKYHSHNLQDLGGVVPVAKGGTGATYGMAALNNLGIFVQGNAPAHAYGRVWIKQP